MRGRAACPSTVENWAFDGPGRTADNVVAGVSGNTFAGCDTWKLAGRPKPSTAAVDNFAPCDSAYTFSQAIPTRGHFDQANYVYVDGHVKSLTWSQVRGNDFLIFKLRKLPPGK